MIETEAKAWIGEEFPSFEALTERSRVATKASKPRSKTPYTRFFAAIRQSRLAKSQRMIFLKEIREVAIF